jgi:AIPR protein
MSSLVLLNSILEQYKRNNPSRATENVHKEIEDYLVTLGCYYDRRKNYYKQEGKPSDKIVGIDRLAQGVLSVLRQEPHTARGRPTTAIKKDEDYTRLFSRDRATHPAQHVWKYCLHVR